jgi:Chaperone of endosialidase
MNPLIQCKTTILPLLIAGVLACFGLLQVAQAVDPPPDGGYPGGNTAEGQSALLTLTTGGLNTAVGWLSLSGNTEGSYNTAIGAGALISNTTAVSNTAIGVGALLYNTTGAGNTATGVFALAGNTSGQSNTANGVSALASNTSGQSNTANGISALASNTTGFYNTAIGNLALNHSTGTGNTALGNNAGSGVTTVSNVICIGTTGQNVPNSCFIGNIYGKMTGFGIPVYINSAGKLGTSTSSQRFKDNIKPMGKASEAILALKPVTFHYKKNLDPEGIPQFGLVAEDVEKVNPDLVIRDKEGKPYTVRYDQVNAMLLNEFLKEHRKIEEQEATIARLQKQIEALAADLQKVSAQLEASKPAPQVVNNP